MKTKIRDLLARQGIQVALLVIALEVITYWSYFMRLTVVNGDANAHYLSDSYYWWNNGGIFNPPDWVAYTWMGRPAGSNIQGGSYVLPQGIANGISPWSPTVSSITSAVLAGLGAVGMYILVRQLTGHHLVSLIALVGQFFAPAIFANAQFLDFHRAAAYWPWVLLVISPLWAWHKRYGIPLAVLILWQSFVGIYPGQLIAAAVCIGGWGIGWMIVSRSRAWIWRVIVSILIAVPLSIVKYVPALLSGTGQRDWSPQRIHLTFPNLASLIYPYDNPAMSSDIAMRPFFIVIPLLLALTFVPWRSRRNLPLYLLGGLSILLLGLATFAPKLLWNIPGMSLSRFWINDFKNFVPLTMIILGSLGLKRLFEGDVSHRRILVGCSIVAAAIVIFGLSLSWNLSGPRLVLMLVPVVLFALTAVTVTNYTHGLWRFARQSSARTLGILLLCLSVASGLNFAYSVTSTWASARERLEVGHYGAEISQLMHQNQACEQNYTRRPERRVSDQPVKDWDHDNIALGGAFTCTDSLSGYANVQGSSALREQHKAFKGEKGNDFIRFYAAAGAVVPLSGGSFADLSDACLKEGRCAGLEYTPLSYSRFGKISYRVEVEHQTEVALNESYYTGWTGKLCDAENTQKCHAMALSAGPGRYIKTVLPAGTYEVNLTYDAPYKNQLQVIFWVCVLLMLASAALPVKRRAAGAEEQKRNPWDSLRARLKSGKSVRM